MRISDWSSDVCSSDLCASGHKVPKRHDSLASHAVSCTTGGDTIRRHNEVADYIKSFMAQRFRVRREVPDLLLQVGSDRRKPADVCIYGYATSGRPLACDVTITKLGRASCRDRGCQYV